MSIWLGGLLEGLRESRGYRQVLEEDAGRQFHVARAARPYLLAALAQDWDGAIICLTSQARRAYNITEQLPIWLEDAGRIVRFAEPLAGFYDRAAWDAAVIRGRIGALSALTQDRPSAHPIIVSSARALMQGTLPLDCFRRATLELALGDRYSLDSLIRFWVGSGYEPATIVMEPGTFSRRGGILDIFPLAAKYPARIEFFDDEIESLREFDPASQRSIKRLSSLRIAPAREALPKLAPPLGRQLRGVTDQAADIESLAMGTAFAHLEHYLPYLHDPPASLLDYAPEGSLILIEDPRALEETIGDLVQQAEANRRDVLAAHQIAESHPAPYIHWERLQEQIHRRRHISLSTMAEGGGPRLFAPGERYSGQLRLMLNQIRAYCHRGDAVVIISEQVNRLRNLWQEQDAAGFIPKTSSITAPLPPGALRFVEGTAAEGWSLQGIGGRLHFITDAEIFGWTRAEPRRRPTASRRGRKTAETAYTDWVEGTFVVHVDYGIGQFAGMRHRRVKATEREYLLIEYRGADTIFVPIHQADRLSRYVGADDKPPKLSQLGKPDLWRKMRGKARQNAEEEARELMDIYRRRAHAAGFAYSPDGAWQHELEAGFPFVETEDQLKVIQEVKRDMESGAPMDRLICGDVGFGKTEVALRAAFKAVQDGAQVAVLAPTTILTQQHFDHFKARLAAFPVTVEMLSRFRSKAQQKGIVERLAAGEIDVIVGTHRLLSADIHFKNLGLMIIDEEQRFGVKHKERFKQRRAKIDILTLTATPIPRTLYMSLSGIRDISMIQTPPEERLPVATRVGAWDDQPSRHAIQRELARGGQVFVVHNRVKTIQAIRSKIEKLVPEATVAVAHGQMPPRALEKVMAAFARGEYDILISTAIIENGIDMPRVNTLIVDRADWFGIAQLYQLRGRVGRSAQQGYAYFFHAPGSLTDEARIRLETLAENTQLGSGFQIAIRDLELRGGGGVLSMRQSGHIAEVGLHLYTDMLQQAIKEQKNGAAGGQRPASAGERVIIDLPMPAYIPTDWVPEMALRLQLYRRIGHFHSRAEVEAMKQELADRFGQLPAAVEGLLYQIEVKLLAQAIQATQVILPRSHVLIKLPYLATVDRGLLALELGADVEVTRTAVQVLAEADVWPGRLIDVLQQLRERIRLPVV